MGDLMGELGDVFNLESLYLAPFGSARRSRLMLYARYPLTEPRFQAFLDVAKSEGTPYLICAPIHEAAGFSHTLGESRRLSRADYSDYFDEYLGERGHVLTSASKVWGAIAFDSDLLVAGGEGNFAIQLRHALQERDELPNDDSRIPERDEVQAFQRDRSWYADSELGRANPDWPDSLLTYIYGDELGEP